jgi:hypothetical protein
MSREVSSSYRLTISTYLKVHMKKHAFIVAVVSCLLAGCATGMTPITTPSGKRGFIIACDSAADGWKSCTMAASSVCSGKYRILDKFETDVSKAYGGIVSRHLVAECKQ